MVFSCGDSTADLKTGSPTVTVSGTTATFSAAQTGNIGVGDAVVYTSGTAFIVAKTSTTVWTVRSATGGNPTAGTNDTVTSIKHAFASLALALTGFDGAGFLNTVDLVAADIQVDIACYRDSADMTGAQNRTATVITTDATRFVRIYTPYDTAVDCNNNQRHNGIWAAQGFLVSHTLSVITISVIRDLLMEGLQVSMDSVANGATAVLLNRNTTEGSVQFRENLVKVRNTHASFNQFGLQANQGSVPMRCANNIFWCVITSGGTITAMSETSTNGSWFNNTVFGATTGLDRVSGTMTSNNNLISAATCFNGTQTQSNNASTDATAVGTSPRINQTFTFENSGVGDLRITAADAGAKGFGKDLSAAAYPFSIDVVRTTRTVPWDVGAYQVSVAGGVVHLLDRGTERGLMRGLMRGVVS